jgi:hypothetical protein
MSTLATSSPVVAGVDPRGLRFSATLTSVVLALVLVSPSPLSLILLAVQAAVFAAGATSGVRRTPYAAAFRWLVRPNLGAPGELEDPRPPRFAQGLGLAFSGAGLVAMLLGLTTLGLISVGLALVAALLNAVLGLCLGCELYLILGRTTAR